MSRLTNSRALSLIALKVEDSPFKKVIKMVKDMIHKLMLEAQEEAEHKAYATRRWKITSAKSSSSWPCLTARSRT